MSNCCLLRKLRDAQEPDFRENTIPAGATDGSVLWNRIEHVPVMGQLVVLKRHQGMASPYTCFSCDCGLSFQSVSVSPLTLGLLPTQTGQDASTGMYFNCNATPLYYGVTSSSNWWSTYPAIAQVNNSTQKGKVTALTGGSTSIKASLTDNVVDNNWYPDYACHYYPRTSTGTGNANVVTISGPQTVWWFNGVLPSGYATNIQLTANPPGQSLYTWSISAGSDKALLTAQSANTIKVVGKALSVPPGGDVKVMEIPLQTPSYSIISRGQD